MIDQLAICVEQFLLLICRDGHGKGYLYAHWSLSFMVLRTHHLSAARYASIRSSTAFMLPLYSKWPPQSCMPLMTSCAARRRPCIISSSSFLLIDLSSYNSRVTYLSNSTSTF